MALDFNGAYGVVLYLNKEDREKAMSDSER